MGRQRERGKAQSRLIDFCFHTSPAVETADCCGAIGCHVEQPLVSVSVPGEDRVLCRNCAAEFVQEGLG